MVIPWQYDAFCPCQSQNATGGSVIVASQLTELIPISGYCPKQPRAHDSPHL